MGKLYTLILLLMCSSVALHSQCAEEQTFVVCDMFIDSDMDGTPDGIINLYDELSNIVGTPITIADGVWFDPDFNFALDATTGNLFLFDLPDSSEAETDYQFEFLDSSSGCPDDLRYLFNIVLGPFSGIAATTIDGTLNLQVCQGAPPFECDNTTSIDLFQTMLSNPSPHGNGEWVYTGTSPNFVDITGNRFLNVNIPYQEGPPLVDEEIFELEYRVPGITPCVSEQVTPVIVAVTKEPFAGFANQFVICETELLAGDFDTDIDLRDDDYLVNENIEGIWLTDAAGQISGPGDSVINLRAIYDDLVATNPEFGCMEYSFTYFVESRSAICEDQQSTISFTFYEFIRPFAQDEFPEVCVGDETNTTLNLYDYIAFAQEGTALFDYPNNECTNWTFISGPSDLGLVSNVGNICNIDPVLDVNYTSQGTIDISQLNDNSAAGTYVFEFTVDESYHCSAGTVVLFDTPDGCSSITQIIEPCDSQTTQVTLIVNPINYAGEDTTGLEFCETEGTLTLTDLLTTNGTDTVYVGPDGVWTDLDSGAIVANDFIIPTITDSQIFNFEYNTTTVNGCEDTALLTFTVYEQFDPGTDDTLVICEVAGEVDLFTLLGGTPDTNGSWTGPNGYSSATNVALFDPAVNVGGDYIYTVPENVSCPSAQVILSISIGEADYAGEDTTGVEVCEITTQVDLFTLLDTNGTDTITTGGEWTDGAGTVIVNPFIFPTNISVSQTFDFTYTTPGTTGCPDEATLSFTVFEQFTAGTGVTVEICTNGMSFNLFDELTNMPDTNGTWSGPEGYTTTDNVGIFDPTVNVVGDYIYTVPENGACEANTATVTVSFFEGSYAGEDTTGVELCETEGPIDLTALLDTNGTDTITTGGEWTDGAGTVIPNPFNIPAIDGQETFNFTYSTSTTNGCNDQATLSFTVFEQNEAGVNATLSFCANEGFTNLFNALGGTADTNGTWTGPDGFTASGTAVVIDLATAVSGDYIYTIDQNGPCESNTATVSLTVFPLSNAGEDVNTFVCPGDFMLSLSDLLEDDVTPNGEFVDLSTGQTVPLGTIDIGLLPDGSYSFLYIVSSGTCPEDDATITFTIDTPPSPTVSDIQDFYCINDGITLGDLIVGGVDDFAWFAFAEAGEELPLSTLLVDGVTYFVAGTDDNGCESERVPYTAEILSLEDSNCQLEITSGVSDNGDGTNDELELGTLPDVFPDFDIQIFNRYGTIVYRGNRNTPLFNGSSNTGSAIGDQLPTGVYFYIFYPNDDNSSPIDGNFYLSR